MTTGGAQITGEDASRGGTTTLAVPSQPKYLYIIRSVLYPLSLEAGFSKKEARQIVLAVDEACSNIIRHAYANDPRQTIEVAVTDEGGRFTVRLRDRGRRVDPAMIAPRDLNEVRPGGLGTHFIRTVFDSVRYDTSGEVGTLLILEKQKLQVGP